MFNSLRGAYNGLQISKTSTHALLDQAGLEWQVEISRTTASHLPKAGETVRLYTWLHHTEDQMSLFGFATQEERRVFLELLKVQGIGPRAALKILSGTTPEGLVRLLEAGDVEGLERIPGLGKKTSQKVLLTLQGKLVLDQGAAAAGSDSPDADIIQALADMGFDRKDAVREVTRLAKDLEHLKGSAREQELLRAAIVALS